MQDGKAATQRHRAGLPSFGMRKVDEERLRISNAAVAFNRVHAADSPAFLSIGDVSTDANVADCNAGSVVFLMKVLRKADSLLAAEKKHRAKQLEESARAFAASRGQEIISATGKDIPAIAEVQSNLSARPADKHTLGIERLCVEPRSEATSKAAIAFDSEEGAVRSKARNLGVGLDAYWSARMRPICAEEWGDQPEEQGRKETVCFTAGHCLCCRAGRQLHRFALRFVEMHKLMTMKDTAERELLKDGVLTWRLRGVPREPLFAALTTGDGSGSDAIDEDTYVFWHVAKVLLKPYVPVFHVLECDSTDNGEKPGPHEELAVKAIRQNRFPLQQNIIM